METEKALNIGIAAAAYYVPPLTKSIAEILEAEGIESPSRAGVASLVAHLGIEQVHVCDEESPSDLALTAARLAIDRSGIQPVDIDVIADFTILPEDYVVPSWSLANKLQHELGAKKAFTIGFSGGGCTNLQVALKFAVSLIREETNIETILFVAGERAIADRRLLNLTDPVTVCGDGSSALVVKSGLSANVILGTDLWSAGEMHDVLIVPGGGLAHPLNYDLYRLHLDRDKYESLTSTRKHEILGRMIDKLLSRLGLALDDMACFVCPNISAADQRDFMTSFGIGEDRIADGRRLQYGHMQSTDLVVGYLSAHSDKQISRGDYVLMCSHGFGYTWGVTLLKC